MGEQSGNCWDGGSLEDVRGARTLGFQVHGWLRPHLPSPRSCALGGGKPKNHEAEPAGSGRILLAAQHNFSRPQRLASLSAVRPQQCPSLLRPFRILTGREG